MAQPQSRKILKSPVLKRRSRLVPKDQKVCLERVLGLTGTSNAALACDPHTGTIAYLAGCVVVLYNPKKNKQSHILNFSKKTLTALAFSRDGKHLVTGESGHQPAVRVWDVAEKVQVAEHHGHKFGISCVCFSPNLKYLVSIGTQHDMMVNVWNWKTGSKVASNKISSKVSSVAFAEDGSHFVTVGMRHVKFWYLESSKSKINETVPLLGRNGLLGDYKNNYFCGVTFGRGHLEKTAFVITQSGLLCQFSEKRQLEKWVELRTNLASCLAVGEDNIFVGCANGVVRVFDATSLKFVSTLPHPHHLGVDVSAAVSTSQITRNDNSLYPDTLALVYDDEHYKVTCIYNDHSLYMWDVHDLKKVGKAWSFLYHSSCIYGLEVYPFLAADQAQVLPPNSFITCSSDDTIRIWNLDTHMPETATYKGNIYSNELLKVKYMDKSLTYLCDVNYNPSGAADKTDTNYDDKNGIRCIRVSPDGQYLASGDRQGNVKIHNMYYLDEVKAIEAHESEVLCLEYTTIESGPQLLASTSRDRLVHVFDVEQQYGLLQTLADHSASISAVKFAQTDQSLKMITCGADKSILFRNLQLDPEFQFTLAHNLAEKTTLYDMDIEASQKFAAIACQDRNVRIYNVKTGKKKKDYKGTLSDDGVLLRIKIDPSGSYAVTSCTDKSLCILDFYTGELLATMYGHSEIPTDVKFMNDLRHILSVSGDGCVFVWRLPAEMTQHMQTRLREMGKVPLVHVRPSPAVNTVNTEDVMDAIQDVVGIQMSGPKTADDDKSNIPALDSNSNIESPKCNFRSGPLPSWAKKVDSSPMSPTQQGPDDPAAGQAPRGRWAQRVDGQGLTVKSQDGKNIEVDLAADRRRYTYEADSLGNQLSDMRRETMVLSRSDAAPKNMPVIFGQDNEEDDDEDFLPSTFRKEEKDKDSKINWDELCNFDYEDLDQPSDSEIIYYPPSESDGSDTLPSSYHVFAATVDGDSKTRSRRTIPNSLSFSSTPDADSETTDPVSLDDTEEDEDSNHSTPSTPMEELAPKTPTREKFLKDTFEDLSFTPLVSTDKFSRGLDTLEEEMSIPPSQAFVNSRSSISARYLSRSQANYRNTGMYGNIHRQDNWYEPIQTHKDGMARNLDESRQILMSMGVNNESPESEQLEDPFDARSSSSPPTKLDFTLTPAQAGRGLSEDLEEQRTPTNFTFDQTYTMKDQPADPPPSPRTLKTLRRSWSALDLPKQPIPEEKGLQSAKSVPKKSGKTANNYHCKTNQERLRWSKIPSPTAHTSKTSTRTNKNWASLSDFGSEDENSRTPTPRSGYRGSTSRPRTLLLKEETKENKPGRNSDRPRSGTKKATTPTLPTTAPRTREGRGRTGRLSTPGGLRNERAVPEQPRRNSSGTNLAKSKSLSLQSLGALKDVQTREPTKPRSKWATKKALYASTPNLLFEDDEDEALESSSKLKSSSKLSGSVPDLVDEVPAPDTKPAKKTPQPAVRRSQTTKVTPESQRRSASTGRLSTGSARTGPEEKGGNLSLMKRVGASASSSKVDSRDLMPPPAKTSVIKSKQESKFVKRAQQQRRKTTSDLTLDQAKNILRGNSGILSKGEEAETSRKSSSSSAASASLSPPPSQITIPDRLTSSLDISPGAELLDPKFMSVATEIETTAAELRKKSSGMKQTLSLDASPCDLPERDIPVNSQTSVPALKVSSSSDSKPVNKLLFSDSGTDSDTPSKSKDFSSSLEDSSGTPRDEEEEGGYPSPSVKDRIANLNRRVSGVSSSSSPGRDRVRSLSPAPERVGPNSPRAKSSVHLCFDSTRLEGTSPSVTRTSSISIATVSVVSTMSNSVTMTTATTTSYMSPRVSTTYSDKTLPHKPVKFDPHREISQSVNSSESVSIGTTYHDSNTVTSALETNRLSPSPSHTSPGTGSNVTSSLDSDSLHRHLSPGSNHSNRSPGSMTDTGLGSDTDTDLSNSLSMMSSTSSVFATDNAKDPVAASRLVLNQLVASLREYKDLNKQVQLQKDERSVEAAKILREGHDEIFQQLHQIVCTSEACPHSPDSPGSQTDSYVTMTTQTYNGLLEKMTDVVSVMKKQSKTLP